MAFIQDGTTTTTVLGVDLAHKAAHVTGRPMEALGHYSLAVATGILPAALAGNSEVFQFRHNAGTGVVVVVKRVTIAACVSTTFFAAGVPVQVDLIRSTSWSGQGTLGTGINLVANGTRDTSYPNSAMVNADIRIATTAALGAGTKTLDGFAQRNLVAPGPITASLNGQIIPPNTDLFDAADSHGYHPLIIRNQQGFSIRSVAVPATGTWTMSVSVEWAELVAWPA